MLSVLRSSSSGCRRRILLDSARPGDAVRRLLAALVLAVALTGCAAEAQPSDGPATVGSRSQVCGDRVDVAKATQVVGQSLIETRELSTFTADKRIGECALQGEDGGAVLAVVVVHDPQGKKLAEELSDLSQTDDYSGDDKSGVAGDARSTTALYAIDKAYYVRVLGLGGTSSEQRQAALELATDVANRSKPLK